MGYRVNFSPVIWTGLELVHPWMIIISTHIRRPVSLKAVLMMAKTLSQLDIGGTSSWQWSENGPKVLSRFMKTLYLLHKNEEQYHKWYFVISRLI